MNYEIEFLKVRIFLPHKASIESYMNDEMNIFVRMKSSQKIGIFPYLVEHLLQVLPSENELSSITEISEKSKITAIVSQCLETYFTHFDELAENPKWIQTMPRYLLSVTDHHWLSHIDLMERLKEGIGLRSYSQEDPMRQYAREGFELFTDMYHQIEKDISIQTASLVKAVAN